MMHKPKDSEREFDIHPEGNFMAVCRDIWVERKANPKYPGTTQYGKPEPEVLVKVILEFLTDEPIEIGGQMLPRFIRYRANLSWHEDSSLRKFIRSWNLAVGKADEADIEVLVGDGAYLTISHSEPVDGKVYANIVGIATPPKGASCPKVPADFIRNKDKQ